MHVIKIRIFIVKKKFITFVSEISHPLLIATISNSLNLCGGNDGVRSTEYGVRTGISKKCLANLIYSFYTARHHIFKHEDCLISAYI